MENFLVSLYHHCQKFLIRKLIMCHFKGKIFLFPEVIVHGSKTSTIRAVRSFGGCQ